MLEVIDVGEASITKREKALTHYGITLNDTIPNGQDASIADREYNCFAVADGVGSSLNSDVAARAVCVAYLETVKSHYHQRSPIDLTQRAYVERTLKHIHSAAVGALATTTFTGMTIHPDDTASYLHVGDSQLLLLRDDELIRYTSEQVKESGYELLNYLGMQPEWAALGYARHSLQMTVESNAFSQTKLEAEWGEIRLQVGDRFALMTDGVSGSDPNDKISDELLKKYLHRRLGAAACARALLAESRKIDDSTIIIVDIGLPEKTDK